MMVMVLQSDSLVRSQATCGPGSIAEIGLAEGEVGVIVVLIWSTYNQRLKHKIV